MTITVAYDQPAAVARTLATGLRRFAGGSLLLIGLAGAIVAVPATFFVIGLALGADYDGLPPEVLLWWWAASTATSIGGVSIGWSLLRRGRRVVLFLRRFGDIEATNVVSDAASKAIAGSFRLVTLADSTIQPLGAAAGVSRASTAGAMLGAALNRFTAFAAERLAPVTLAAALAAAGYAYVATGDVVAMADIAARLFSGRVPLASMGFDPVGLFAIAATVAAAGLLALLASFVMLLVRFPLGAVLLVVRSANRAVADAEHAKLMRVRDRADIPNVAAHIARQSRRVIAPRLVVVRVATAVWQETVQRLADVAEIVLIDVSEPSENLNWEVEHMVAHRGPRCVFTCHRSTVDALLTPTSGDVIAEKLAGFIGSSLVLAYTDDPAGSRRFATALRRRMLDVARSP